MLSFRQLDLVIYEYFERLLMLGDLNYSSVQRKYLLALQANIFDRLWAKNQVAGSGNPSMVGSITRALRWHSLDQFLKLFTFSFRNDHPRSGMNILFAENFITHILDLFVDLNEKSDNHKFLFLTDDIRALKYVSDRTDMACVFLNFLDIFSSKVFRNFFQLIRDQREVIGLRKSVQNDLGELLGYKEKNISRLILSNSLILPLFSLIINETFDKMMPRSVTVGCDGFSLSRLVLYAAKARNIRSYVVQHGLIGAYNAYLPLVADSAFVWSINEARFFNENGVPASRIVVSGTTKRPQNDVGTEKHPSNPQTAKSVLVVSSPGATSDIKRLLDLTVLISSMVDFPHAMVFRPHPSMVRETKNIMLRDEYKKIQLDDRTLEESLIASDCVVSEFSSVLVEALTYQIPTVLISTSRDCSLGEEIYSLEAFEHPDDIAKHLSRILCNSQAPESKLATLRASFYSQADSVRVILDGIEGEGQNNPTGTLI